MTGLFISGEVLASSGLSAYAARNPPGAGLWTPPSGEAPAHCDDRHRKPILDGVTLGDQRPQGFERIAVVKMQDLGGLVLRDRLASLMRLVHCRGSSICILLFRT